MYAVISFLVTIYPIHACASTYHCLSVCMYVCLFLQVSVLLEAEATPTAPRQQQLDITAIPVAEFGKYVATNHSNNNRGFQDLYGVSCLASMHAAETNDPCTRIASCILCTYACVRASIRIHYP